MKCKIGARSGNTCHPEIEANYEFKTTLGCTWQEPIANNKKDKKKTKQQQQKQNNISKIGSATDKPRKVSNT